MQTTVQNGTTWWTATVLVLASLTNGCANENVVGSAPGGGSAGGNTAAGGTDTPATGGTGGATAGSTGGEAGAGLTADGGSGSGGGEPDCSPCEALQVPGCCEGSWTCPEGECVYQCDNGATPPLIWEVNAIIETNTLDAVTNTQSGYPKTVKGVVLHDVTFTSWQWIGATGNGGAGGANTLNCDADGPLVQTPIRIHAIMGIPEDAGSNPLPGLLVGHGMRGQVEPWGGNNTYNEVIDTAKNLGIITIGISAPGNGDSEGCGTQAPKGGSACAMFNTAEDVRGSWLYAYALAGMRALTYLTTRPEVDAGRLAVTGSSGGGIMTYLVNGVDPRVRAAIPRSACGGLEFASQTPESWVTALMADCGLTNGSEQMQKFAAAIDPMNYAPLSCGPTFLINGFQDEFFPIHATAATYEALLSSGQDVWWNVLPNWDHGYFALPKNYCASGGLIDAALNTAAALARSHGAVGYWLHHYVTGDASFTTKPAEPVLSVTDNGNGTAEFVLTADDAMPVLAVKVWLSADNACTVDASSGHELTLLSGSNTEYAATIPLPIALDDLVYWAEVKYQLTETVAPLIDFVHVSTPPVLPTGFTPQIRPFFETMPNSDPCVSGTCQAI